MLLAPGPQRKTAQPLHSERPTFCKAVGSSGAAKDRTALSWLDQLHCHPEDPLWVLWLPGTSPGRARDTHPTTVTHEDVSSWWDRPDTEGCCSRRFVTAELLDPLAKGLTRDAWFAQTAPGTVHAITSGL